jgi:hypothetical protein
VQSASGRQFCHAKWHAKISLAPQRHSAASSDTYTPRSGTIIKDNLIYHVYLIRDPRASCILLLHDSCSPIPTTTGHRQPTIKQHTHNKQTTTVTTDL